MANQTEETEPDETDAAPPSEDPRFIVVETTPDRYPDGRLGGVEPGAYVIMFATGEELAECWDADVARIVADALNERCSDGETIDVYDSDGEGLDFEELDE